MPTQSNRRFLFLGIIAAFVAVVIIWPPVRIKRTAANPSIILDDIELGTDNIFAVPRAQVFSFTPGIELSGSEAPEKLWITLQLPKAPRIQVLTNHWGISEKNGLLEFTSSGYQKTNCAKRSGRTDYTFPMFAFGYEELVLASLVVKAGADTNWMREARVQLSFSGTTNGGATLQATGENAKEWMKRTIGPKYDERQLYFLELSKEPKQP